MDNQDIMYESFIKRLKNNVPSIKDPDGMINSVLEKIEHEGSLRRRNRKLRIISLFSGAAAVFLLCFLIQDVFYIHGEESRKNVVMHVNSIQTVNNAFKDKNINETIKEKIILMHQKEQILLLIKK